MTREKVFRLGWIPYGLGFLLMMLYLKSQNDLIFWSYIGCFAFGIGYDVRGILESHVILKTDEPE